MESKPTYGTMTDFKQVAQQIKKALELETDDNPQAIQAKISELSVLIASAAALQANAKKALLQKELELIQKYEKDDLAPSLLMRKITAETFEESAWLTYAERLGAGISHSLDSLRSVLSFIKMELEQIKRQEG